MKRTFFPLLILIAATGIPALEEAPLLDSEIVAALASEVSGESAMRNLEFLATQHRMRGSRGFRDAAEHVARQLEEYGLQQIELNEFPVDGEIFYGTQRSRPAWDVEFAELWELGGVEGEWHREERVADWNSIPVSVAQDSESGRVVAELVDVGEGVDPADYAGKNVAGKLVLCAQQPQVVAALAIDEFGAAGIISYAQNQRTAWWKEDETLVRWGHLGSFRTSDDFAFMVSLQRARRWQERLRRGETVMLEAEIRGGRHRGAYTVVTAAIEGTNRADEEIVYSCHLDHQRPGANDNASGSVAILEVARTLQKLIDEGRLERPSRTIRFVWPPEIEGTMALLVSRPEWASRIKAVIHLDMVGGAPSSKAIFHVTRGPASRPSFINDVAEAFGRFVNEQSDAHASGKRADHPLVAAQGGQEALLAQMVDFSMGSDHQIYSEGSWGIPSIYFNDWPDRYIHTHKDAPANVDPTKLERSAFLAAASGWTLATLEDRNRLWPELRSASLARVATALRRLDANDDSEQRERERRFAYWFEETLLASVDDFVASNRIWQRQRDAHMRAISRLLGDMSVLPKPRGEVARVYSRVAEPKGPMSVFGYDYFEAHVDSELRENLKLPKAVGARGAGAQYCYEALNLVDGERTVGEIHDFLCAIYGKVPFEDVSAYLAALYGIGVLSED